MTEHHYKVCPVCHAPAILSAVQCQRPGCGHVFVTQFTPPQAAPPDPTQAYPYPPHQQPHYPPPYHHPGYGYYPPPQPPPPPPGYVHPAHAGPPLVPPGYVWAYPGTHSTVIAALLSAFVCIGAGQFYNRQPAKGAVVMTASIFLALCTWGLSLFLTFPAQLIDAVMVAARLERGEVVGPWQFF